MLQRPRGVLLGLVAGVGAAFAVLVRRRRSTQADVETWHKATTPH